MLKFVCFFKWVLAAILAFSVPANAMLYDIVWQGKVHSGFDDRGLFGQAGWDIVNSDVTATFRFDSEINHSKYKTWKIEGESVDGGTYDHSQSPLIFSSLDINGHTIFPIGDLHSYNTRTNITTIVFAQFAVGVISNPDRGNNSDEFKFYANWPFQLQDLDLTSPLLNGGSISGNYFSFDENFIETSLNFYGGDISIVQVATVPEPDVWILSIISFFLVAVNLRMRDPRSHSRVRF